MTHTHTQRLLQSTTSDTSAARNRRASSNDPAGKVTVSKAPSAFGCAMHCLWKKRRHHSIRRRRRCRCHFDVVSSLRLSCFLYILYVQTYALAHTKKLPSKLTWHVVVCASVVDSRMNVARHGAHYSSATSQVHIHPSIFGCQALSHMRVQFDYRSRPHKMCKHATHTHARADDMRVEVINKICSAN